MKDLLAKIGRFCENHVEKIVLVVVGALCAWLFFTRVIFSPNVMAIDRTNKMVAPGQIDRNIYEKAQELRAKLQQSKKSEGRPYQPRLDGPIEATDDVIAAVLARSLPQGFAGLFESPLGFLSATTTPIPAVPSARQQYAQRKYRLPLIPEVTSVGANLIRAAAYVPLQEITPQSTYDKVATEPNDVDLVTVEARIDVAEVFRRFQASFAGVDVQREEWRDPCLAKPVFAAVQLQRQELLEDGTWDQWRPIPRSRVEANRDLFQVFERVEDLPPGGLDVRLMHFDRHEIVMELFQPESYQIASAEEEWFPPSYYGKFKDLQRKMDAEKRREEKEKDRKQTDRGGTDLRREAAGRGGQMGAGAYGPTQGATRGGPPGSSRIRGGAAGGAGGMPGDTMYNQRGARGGRGTAGPGMPGDPTMGGRGRTPPRRGGAGDPYGDMYGMPGDMGMRGRTTTNEVYWDFAADMIAYREDLSKRDKPLLTWGFDDTVEPGKTYQYRVRLGVFNPVAGTGQVTDRDLDKKDQVILWSPYSDITKPIQVQERIYLFAKDAQDKTKTATVEVARYTLGYWRSENFQVRPGEAIGKEMEPKKEDDKTKSRARLAAGYQDTAMMPDRITDLRGGMMPGYMGSAGMDQQNVPKKVNYRTGKVLVDLVQVNDWGNAPNLRPRLYFDMLYTSDGMHIEHMPVNANNWPKDLAAAYQYIQAQKRTEPQPFRAFNKSGMMRGRGAMPGMEGYDDLGMYEDMGGYDGGGLNPY